MATLTIDDVPEELARDLTQRAAEAGVSLGAFLRELLARNAAAPKRDFVSELRAELEKIGWDDTEEEDTADYLNRITEEERRRPSTRPVPFLDE